MSWSRSLHRYHPHTFKEVARLLLLASCVPRNGRQPRGPGGDREAGPPELFSPPLFDWSRLPQPVLERILQFASQPVSVWLNKMANACDFYAFWNADADDPAWMSGVP